MIMIKKTALEQEADLHSHLDGELARIHKVKESLQDQIDALDELEEVMRFWVGSEIAKIYEAEDG